MTRKTEAIATTSDWISRQPDRLQTVFRSLAESADANPILRQLAVACRCVIDFEAEAAVILENFESLSWPQLQEQLGNIESAVESVPDFLSCLQKMESLPADLTSCIRATPFTFTELESVIADETYQSILRSDSTFKRFQFYRT